MRAVIQRVSSASVTIDQRETARIDQGLLVLVGVELEDRAADVEWLAGKISRLRIFSDPQGLMNLDVSQVGGKILVVSQFTLFASTKKGNRPSFTGAAKPEISIPLYESFLDALESITGQKVERGVFGADMKVTLTNDGPVTILMDSKAPE
jgi:D-tyrosyl-tRNA(Tyr) deacylase